MSAIVALAQRFRARLQLSLDELGFSPGLRDRSRTLAFQLGIHESSANELLTMGRDSLPDLPLLVKISDLTGKPLGWFLDQDGDSFPAGTRLVHSIGSGEDLAFSLPDGLAGMSVEPNEQLLYLRASGDMGFGVQGGDYILAVEVPVTPMSVTKNQVYLIGSKLGFELRNCVAQSPLRASFSSFDGKHTLVLKPTIAEADRRDSNFLEDGLGEGMHHFSQVLCVIKAAKNIPRDGGAYLFIS
jgi:hypothetical protein